MIPPVSGRTTITSAPGKVLLAGGYLVLDRLYTGLVVATSSRFYCCITDIPSSSASSCHGDTAGISVRAGQFPEDASTWSYTLTRKHGSELSLEPLDPSTGRNKFVEISLAKTLEYALETLSAECSAEEAGTALLRRVRGDGAGMDIVVLADNDFYSQREQLAEAGLPPLISSLASLPPFCPLPRPLHQTNKTGLGSSAALVTSLTSALLVHLNIVPTDPDAYALDLIHSLAQYAHCLAQGKVGSGFDVASAVYGTHVYRRFSPSLLTPLMRDRYTSIKPDSGLIPALKPEKWDQGAEPFRLPKGLRLMLADVDAGTDTPSFVGRVLAWREREKETAAELFTDLGSANDTLGRLLKDLSSLEDDPQYAEVLQLAARTRVEELGIAKPASQLLVRIHASLALIRSYLQHMSILSSVPIEPVEQTRLLDACSACPGVLGGGVPGAGGYDAIFLLVVDHPTVVSRVEDVWSAWKEMSVCPLSARQSDEGLRRERAEDVPGMAQALESGQQNVYGEPAGL